MIIQIIIAMVIGIAVLAAVLFILINYLLKSALPNFTKTSNEQLIMMAKQQLTAEKQDIKTDLENKKEIIEKLVKRIHDELSENDDRLRSAEEKRIGSFSELKEAIKGQSKLTDQLRITTESLSKVLSSNQMRGQWGEKVAGDLLEMNGFVRGQNYEFNKEQDTGKRPDFTIFLPNKAKVNVDAKFPYQNLKKMTETNDISVKADLKKMFERDVKEKIKQVTTRDYINPEDNTVDFVILFIPNEMVFSFIYESMSEVWVEAMRQKVILAGPFTFTAILRMVSQAYENFKYQKNVQKIIGHIRMFVEEFNKYNLEFDKIGERIESLSKQYNMVKTTRSNQLMKTAEKVKLEDGGKTSVQPLLH
ncbi:MAG: DNA recombination protein RmuC [Patescibacteria group bacterium]